LCGDSSKPKNVDRLLDGAPIHLVNTDPPYNVRVEPRSNNAIAAGLSSFAGYGNSDPGRDAVRCPEKAQPTTRKLRAKDRPLENDFVSEEEFDRLLDAWFGNIARVLLPGRSAYIWGGYANPSCVRLTRSAAAERLIALHDDVTVERVQLHQEGLAARLPWPSLAARTAAVGDKRTGGEGAKWRRRRRRGEHSPCWRTSRRWA
jgi:DNA modification methylase